MAKKCPANLASEEKKNDWTNGEKQYKFNVFQMGRIHSTALLENYPHRSGHPRQCILFHIAMNYIWQYRTEFKPHRTEPRHWPQLYTRITIFHDTFLNISQLTSLRHYPCRSSLSIQNFLFVKVNWLLFANDSDYLVTPAPFFFSLFFFLLRLKFSVRSEA